MPSGSIRKVYDQVYPAYDRVIVIPIAMVLVAAAILGVSALQTGEVVSKGIDFTGGTAIQVQVAADTGLGTVREAFDREVTVRTMSGSGDAKWLVIESAQSVDQSNTGAVQQDIRQRLTDAGVDVRSEVSVRVLGAAVGSAFFQEAQLWSLVAVLIMSAVIFVAFRTVVPSFAVIFAALSDILFALAGMSLLGIDLTLGSLAALLMLLGYSVDTDILLSTRVLKQHKDDLQERIWSSIVTGSTMTGAAIAAFGMLFIVSPSPVLQQIAAVIVIGLAADLPITWLGNTVILKWYVER